MLFFDLKSLSWVVRPGSDTPPQMQPVLTIGATYQIGVSFVRGEDTVNVGGSAFYGGIKIKSAYSGTVIASDSSPIQDGDETTVFSIDLTTTDGKSYFTANPTIDSVEAVFVVVATIDGVEFKTPPLEITLQNDYFPLQ